MSNSSNLLDRDDSFSSHTSFKEHSDFFQSSNPSPSFKEPSGKGKQEVFTYPVDEKEDLFASYSDPFFERSFTSWNQDLDTQPDTWEYQSVNYLNQSQAALLWMEKALAETQFKSIVSALIMSKNNPFQDESPFIKDKIIHQDQVGPETRKPIDSI